MVFLNEFLTQHDSLAFPLCTAYSIHHAAPHSTLARRLLVLVQLAYSTYAEKPSYHREIHAPSGVLIGWCLMLEDKSGGSFITVAWF